MFAVLCDICRLAHIKYFGNIFFFDKSKNISRNRPSHGGSVSKIQVRVLIQRTGVENIIDIQVHMDVVLQGVCNQNFSIFVLQGFAVDTFFFKIIIDFSPHGGNGITAERKRRQDLF